VAAAHSAIAQDKTIGIIIPRLGPSGPAIRKPTGVEKSLILLEITGDDRGVIPLLRRIFAAKTIVVAPHHVWGPETNDLVLQLRKRKISKIILAGLTLRVPNKLRFVGGAVRPASTC
jgi:hypothetical protein